MVSVVSEAVPGTEKWTTEVFGVVPVWGEGARDETGVTGRPCHPSVGPGRVRLVEWVTEARWDPRVHLRRVPEKVEEEVGSVILCRSSEVTEEPETWVVPDRTTPVPGVPSGCGGCWYVYYVLSGPTWSAVWSVPVVQVDPKTFRRTVVPGLLSPPPPTPASDPSLDLRTQVVLHVQPSTLSPTRVVSKYLRSPSTQIQVPLTDTLSTRVSPSVVQNLRPFPQAPFLLLLAHTPAGPVAAFLLGLWWDEVFVGRGVSPEGCPFSPGKFSTRCPDPLCREEGVGAFRG